MQVRGHYTPSRVDELLTEKGENDAILKDAASDKPACCLLVISLECSGTHYKKIADMVCSEIRWGGPSVNANWQLVP